MMKRFVFMTWLIGGWLAYGVQGSEELISNAEMVTYASGNEMVASYLAAPDGEGPFPALIVIHEWWGLNDWVKEKSRALASRGYVALAVDLYRGKTAQDAEEAHELSRGLPNDRAARDLAAAYAFLHGESNVQGKKIGVIGWCMGGGYSLQAALANPPLSACVVNYGRLVTDESEVAKLPCPLLGIFGGKDRGIPVTMVKQFEDLCRKAGKDVTIKIYPDSGHAFMNPNNQAGYNAADTEDAWGQIYTFLQRTLRD